MRVIALPRAGKRLTYGAMAKVIRRDIRASELPQAWASELDVAPDVMVRVTVDARPRRDIGRLLHLTDRASKEARRRGLTGRKLRQLLHDAWSGASLSTPMSS